MIPLKQSEVVCGDGAMALLIVALTLTTRELGGVVGRSAPFPGLHSTGRSLRRLPRASRLVMADAAHRSQADSAVLPGASFHLRLECSWSHPAGWTDLRRTHTTQSRECH